MTFRTREEYLAASEEFAPFHQHGSVLFSQPSEVTHWCQSVPLQEGFPPTPPDTASDCAASDYSDMAHPSWNMASQPGDSWTAVSAQDHSPSMQPTVSSWHSQGTPVTSQDPQALEASWMNVSQGPVDMGLSPVLSHESQSLHTLVSFSEPDVTFLPPGLDLSFIDEASWQATGHVAYPSSQCVAQDYTPSTGASPQHVPYGVATGHPNYSSRSNVACGPQHQAVYFPTALSERTGCDQPMVHGRPLLPRGDAYSFQGVPPNVGHVALQARSVSRGNSEHIGRVSSAGIPAESISPRPVSIRSVRHMVPVSQAALASPVGQIPTPRSDSVPIPVGMPALVAEPAHEDFSSFIQYDQEDKVPATATRSDHVPERAVESDADEPSSYSEGYGPVDSMPALATPEQEDVSRNLAEPSNGPAMPSEAEEGRYRNHPLYSEGPHADGLYHCPFKSDPSCQHKATKLKCNYDKFIDSHLKPFRCKIEACSKQEFSSTACLLRHEREAHGMHGHGDRPHLCFYPGCERGISGNGFPRRYNLYDHMRRVHDHKDEPSKQEKSASGSLRKPGSRKRRASITSEEPAAQRVKVQPKREDSQTIAIPTCGPSRTFFEHQEAHFGHQRQQSDHNRQRVLYSQWAQQRELLNFQMSSVQGPDDEVNLQRLSQNIEELRRLSHQARQG